MHNLSWISKLHINYVGDIQNMDPTIGNDDNTVRHRRDRASEITRQLQSSSDYSFVRIGDMELTLLLGEQDGLVPGDDSGCSIETANGTKAMGNPGIATHHLPRLRKAYEDANYVDFHEAHPINQKLLPQLRLNRTDTSSNRSDASTSMILFDWVLQEFKTYCESAQGAIGIAAAESSLLECLSLHPDFDKCANEVWPGNAKIHFHQIRNDGKHLDRDLDLIKADLTEFVDSHGIGTLFLSLGGGAKILCVELAKEMVIRTFDFGAATRGLCDVGSYGNLSGRSCHSITFFNLPCDMVVDAMEQVWELEPQELLAKTIAQIIHQLRPPGPSFSRGAANLDLSPAGKKKFSECLASQLPRLNRLRDTNEDCIAEWKRFLHFCGKHELTPDGIKFLKRFEFKQKVRNLIPFLNR